MTSGVSQSLKNPAQLPEIRIVSQVPEAPGPQDSIPSDQKETRHSPGVLHRASLPVTLPHGPCRLDPDTRPQQLAQAGPLDPEGIIEDVVGIGDCPSLPPELVEENLPLLHRTQMKEQERGIGTVLFQDSLQLSDGLLAKDSVKVAQKDQ